MKNKKFSIYFIINSILALIIVISIGIFIYVNVTAEGAIESQVRNTNQISQDYYVRSLDSSLNTIDNYLFEVMGSNTDVSILEINSSAEDTFEANRNVSKMLRQASAFNKDIDGFFFYSPEGLRDEYLINSLNAYDFSDSRAIESSIKNIIHGDEALNTANWFFKKINNENYLLRIIKTNNSYCGAWVSKSSLVSQLEKLKVNPDSSIFIFDKKNNDDTELNSLNENNSDSKYGNNKLIILESVSESSDLLICSAIPVNSVTQEFNEGISNIINLYILVLVLIVCLIFSIRLTLRPFRFLVDNMKQVGSGALETRLSENSRIYEYYTLSTSFNYMLEEIQNLKISVYEKQIEKQKINRRFLKMQLKSHFFLNCLNIMYSLAQTRKYALIQELTMSLVKYFRYISNTASELMPVYKEIEHIRNYMKIQTLRFPQHLKFDCIVDKRVNTVQIPQLILQTFLENSIEHGMDFNKDNIISLSVSDGEQDADDSDDCIVITVNDSGGGFSEELLGILNEDSVNSAITDIGIGIRNVKERIKIIYQGHARISFSNNQYGGARVDIILPKEISGGKEEVSNV